MKKLMLVVGIAVLAAPAISNAQIGVRLGLETPLYTHFDQNGQSGSYSIGDTFQPAINVLVEYYPIHNIGLGLEFKEGFVATGTVNNCVSLNCGYTRTGTNLGPNVTLDLVPLPIFLRAALPVHLEPGSVTWNFRAAGGLEIGIAFASLYLELAADFPMVGSGVSFFGSQQLAVGAGLWFKF
jgi:hypothetical protein